jgi:ring-1,2-phenylacetyl-CoA epoxidase subunit PaaC
MGRPEREFLNLLLVEQPNRDFAQTMVRGFFFDGYQVGLWESLADTDDTALAGIAARALKEARYHLLHSSTWVIRLGDGTEESHRRTQEAVDRLWRYTDEMFEESTSSERETWDRVVRDVLAEATLDVPEDSFQRSGGRRGLHSEHLGPLLAEMQWLQRSYPGQRW